ncbi:MAG: hypothetical protein Q9203_005714, partial [Teloschistes exilis]
MPQKPPPGQFSLLYFASAATFTRKASECLPAPLSIPHLFKHLEKSYPGIENVRVVKLTGKIWSWKPPSTPSFVITIALSRPHNLTLPCQLPPILSTQLDCLPLSNLTIPGQPSRKITSTTPIGPVNMPLIFPNPKLLLVTTRPNNNNNNNNSNNKISHPPTPSDHALVKLVEDSRKRQKKTDSRVAELEKKIDALTASLHATKAQAVSESDDDSADDRKPVPHITAPNFRPSDYGPQDEQRIHEPANLARQRPSEPYGEQNERLSHQPPLITERKRRMSQYPEEESGHHQGPFNLASPLDHSAQAAPGTSHVGPTLPNGTSNSMPPTTPQSTSPAHEYADVVDRKIVDAALASALFEEYTRRMAHHLPLVVFPPDTPAGTIRKHRPTLFLAILSVASGQDHPDIQRILAKEIMRTFADKIVYGGEKSLELIQALQVVTIWSWPEENREPQTYQLIHMAAVMAIDLGLGKRIKSDREPSQSLWKEYSRTKAMAQAMEDPDSWRAWLGCYLLCASASMGLRRPNLIRWTSQMDDCLESLKTCPDNLPLDSVLVDLVRLQRLADDVGNQISLDDSSHMGISDIKTQYALKGFERQMRDWEQQASKQANSMPLTFNFHVANLYMHELAMHLNQSLDQASGSSNPQGKKAETGRTKPEVLTSAHVGALTTCLTSIHGMFDTFLRSTTEDIRTVPVCFFVRVAHAALLLIKMHFAASTAESELGKVISSDDMRVEDYLRRIRELLQAGAASDKCRPARLFFLWIGLLQTWFERQRSGKGSLSEDAANGRRVEAQPVDVEKQAAKGEYKRMQLNEDAPPARRYSMASGASAAGVEGMDQSRLHMLGE